MDPTVEEYITFLNKEANRLSNLVETPIGNWLPDPTFQAAQDLVVKFEEYLPAIKAWVASYESDPKNHPEIWLRQGLDLASNRETWSNLENHIYSPATGFCALDGVDYQLDYTTRPPPKPEMTPEIEAMHEGKPCESNGWYCWICEDQDHELWKLQQLLIKASRNIFVNESLKEPFIKAALEAKLKPYKAWNLQDYFTIERPKHSYYQKEEKPTKGRTYGQQVKDFIKEHITELRFWYSQTNVTTCQQYMQIARQVRLKDDHVQKLKLAAALVKQ
jgi:hypothetical protein